MGRGLLGQGTLMLILGIYSTVVFTLLHVRYSYALGVVMGVFNIIPVIGAMISMALVIVAAAMGTWVRVLYVCIAYGIYAQVENSYLTPKIMQSSVDLPGLAIIIALLLGSAIDGIMGAMVSVPTAVLVAVILNETPSRTINHKGIKVDMVMLRRQPGARRLALASALLLCLLITGRPVHAQKVPVPATPQPTGNCTHPDPATRPDCPGAIAFLAKFQDALKRHDRPAVAALVHLSAACNRRR